MLVVLVAADKTLPVYYSPSQAALPAHLPFQPAFFILCLQLVLALVEVDILPTDMP